MKIHIIKEPENHIFHMTSGFFLPLYSLTITTFVFIAFPCADPATPSLLSSA